MKICTKCKKEKDESQFGILKSGKNGLNPRCKKCQQQKMKEWIAKPENRERVNRNCAMFRRTEKGKAIKKKYYYSDKGQNTYKKYNEMTARKKARQAVNHAVEKGTIPPAKNLECLMNDGNCEGRMEYHHNKGYNKNHWLDVIPLCRKHHCIIDGHNYHSS